jgi:hypothetical protein
MPSDRQRVAAADVLAAAKPKTSRVRLLLDGDLFDEHATLSAALEAAADEEKEALAEQVLDLEQRMADTEVEFVQKGMGRGRWRKLAADHPARDEDKAAGLDFNADTFPFAALAECLVEPVMTADELVQLHDEVLDEVQFSQLWSGCLKVNMGGGLTRPESQAARAIQANGRLRSVQPSNSESAEAS